jgi:N-succinyldiaminopimelate aminotransferase
VNPLLGRLAPYPFERLRALIQGIAPARERAINLSIGEPRHPTPPMVIEALCEGAREGLAHYPMTLGPVALREADAPARA